MYGKKLVPIAFAVVLATGAAGTAAVAHADQGQKSDAAEMATAKVTLSQAIATAEQKTGGNAVNAGIENGNNGAFTIEVDVANKKGVETVAINPQTGQVISTKPASEGDSGD